MITCGWAIHIITNSAHWTLVNAYRAMFIMYASVGMFKFLLVLSQSSKVESDRR